MIAITVSENKKNAKIESCFGKSEYFFIIDIHTKEPYFIKNSAKGLLKNSGKEAASFLIKKGVKTVISANFGVPVKEIFDKHKVQMVIISSKIKNLNDIKRIKNK
jgi:predicted Fe-Mo cluster-binding NifX family protein